ncbi:MAG TPA: DUF2782 domain-containing protein [Xanthomonadales bacterium]|nr:DUF2782 domain-containing protein [Xanthomonadales bacterium]
MNSSLMSANCPMATWLARRLLWLVLALLPMALQAQDNLERPPEIPPEGAPLSEPLSLPEDEAESTSSDSSQDATQDIPTNDDEAPLPPKVQDEQIEPTVTIRDEEGKRIEEYSRNGQVYMVKVIPDKGVPYYYIDSDGDGQLETSPTKDLEQVRPVYWKVKEWD